MACAPSAPDPGEARAPVSHRAAGPPVASGSAASVTTDIPAQAAFLVVDAEGRTLASQLPAVLDAPILGGSLMKPVTLAAARDAGLVDERTRIDCLRQLRIDGHDLDCVHVPLGHAVSPSEALSHSCNTFVTRAASRLPVSALSGAAVAIGLPSVPAGTSLSLAAIGLDGARATPRRWLSAFRALVARERSAHPSGFVLEGLSSAARDGTAAALGDAGIAAYAKTGTAPMPGGGMAGLLVAVGADGARAIVVVAPGAAGRDAATIAARAWRRVESSRGATSGTRVRVGVTGANGYDVEEVPLDDYVAGVVDAEAPPDASPGFRRTLAIAARTWLRHNQRRHAADGFEVCDLTHCQVFREGRATGRAAAEDTRGIILAGRDGRPIDAEYSASCGGRLESGPDPAGVAHADSWRASLDAADLSRALRPLGIDGATIEHLAVAARTPSGRARTIVVRTRRDHTIDAEAFRLAVGRALGWQHLKSTWFTVEPSSRGFVFEGRGHGHGRGLCVRGAIAMGEGGASVERVLAAYFPGAVAAVDAADITITVTMPRALATRRGRVERDTRRALARAAVRLGVGVPSAVTVTVHPTIESFQRATGSPWWVSARTRGTTIDTIPVDLLEQRGRLDATLRHEAVHVLTAPRLAGAPRWMHEGLAMVIAGAPAPDPKGMSACPADADFDNATADALPGLYARATACVQRELAAHPWTALATSAR